MADTTLQRQFPVSQRSVPRRSRGGSASGGVMILMSILLFGSALIIPAGQAIQEANMRDRIASMTAARDTQITTSNESTSDSPSASVPEVDRRQQVIPGDSGSGLTPVLEDEDESGVEQLPESERMAKPRHLHIPSVGVETGIVPVTSQVIEVDGQRVREWDVASYVAGHHDTSARPGEGGNSVITGHNDFEGEVFRTLEHVELGADVYIETEDGIYHYIVEEFHMRREVNVSLEERLSTGQFMAPMEDERITMITCWPYGINDHRVIVVARPAGPDYFVPHGPRVSPPRER